MREVLIDALRALPPIYLSFMSGMLASIGGNIYTSVMLSESSDVNLPRAATSSALLVVSSLLLIILSAELQDLRDEVAALSGDTRANTHRTLTGERLPVLAVLVLSAAGCGAAAVLLMWGLTD